MKIKIEKLRDLKASGIKTMKKRTDQTTVSVCQSRPKLSTTDFQFSAMGAFCALYRGQTFQNSALNHFEES